MELPPALTTSNVPAIRQAVADRAAQFAKTRQAALAGYAADGERLYIGTSFASTPQLHIIDRPLGARRQLTFFDEPIASPTPSPTDPDLIAFLGDVGGSEAYGLSLFDAASGTTRPVSTAGRRANWPTWSPDGERLFWAEASPGGKTALMAAAVDRLDEVQQVAEYQGTWFPVAWSPTNDEVLLYHFVALDDSELHLLDLTSRVLTKVNPDLDRVGYGRAVYAPDGEHLYIAMNAEDDFLRLHRYHIPSGARTLLTGDVDWDVELVAASPDGKSYAAVFNEAGASRLQIYDASTDKVLRSPDLPLGVIRNILYAPKGDRLAFTFEGATSPGDVWEWRLKGRGRRLTRWTESEVGGLDSAAFTSPRLIEYPTFDEQENGEPRMISALVYPAASEEPSPVIISIHGGPPGQSRPTFNPSVQYWGEALGATVILPNVRGSTGYGERFQLLDNGRLREDSVRDIGALLDWIDAQPELDSSRVVVTGTSYGGYMTLASLAAYGSRLSAGVDVVGISNFVTFLEGTAPYRRATRRPEYGDERDPEMRAFLNAISPLTNAHRICQPLFVAQGENDRRVPAAEARQIIAAVEANGGEPWSVFAANEGHGFRRSENAAALNAMVVTFFDRAFSGDLPTACNVDE